MLHIPCIWHWPGTLRPSLRAQADGEQRDQMVEAVDILPTLLEVAGVTQENWPAAQDGQSAWSFLSGQTATHRSSIYAEHYDPRSGDSVRVVRKEDFKLVRRASGSEELHRCDRPVPEAENLAGDARYASELSAMRSLLIERMMASDRKDVVRTHNY
jgi:arylsulfatase A-like enzyme